MKRILTTRAGVWIVVFIILSFSHPLAQPEIYIYDRVNPNHPDGVINKIAFSLSSSYSSVTKVEGYPYVDRQALHADLNWVTSKNLTWKNRIDIIKEDTVHYQFNSLFTYYLSDPINTIKTVNPDGVVGSPSLTLGGGIRLHSNKEIKRRSFVKVESVLPVSWYLSTYAGMTNYKEIEESDTDEFYGGISIYFKKYTTNKFDNPDCPVGSIALSLSGGSSERGSFGKIEFFLAPANSFTVKLLAQSESFDPPFEKIHTAALGFSYYSGK